jgi:hypothetical protein
VDPFFGKYTSKPDDSIKKDIKSNIAKSILYLVTQPRKSFCLQILIHYCMFFFISPRTVLVGRPDTFYTHNFFEEIAASVSSVS